MLRIALITIIGLFQILNGLSQVTSNELNDKLENYRLSKLEGDTANQIEALHEIAVHLKRVGELDSSIIYLKKELELSKLKGDTYNYIRSLNALGIVEKQRGNFSNSEEYYNRALLSLGNDGDSLLLAKIHNNLGLVQKLEGKVDDALSNFIHSIRIRTELKDSASLVVAHNNLALLYMEIEDFNDAIDQLQLAKRACRNYGSDYKMSIIDHNLGLSYLGLNSIDDAISYLTKAKKARSTFDDPVGKASIDMSFGKLWLQEKEYSKALDVLTKAQHVFISKNSEKLLDELYYLKAMTLKKVGQSDSASHYFEMSIEQAEKHLGSRFLVKSYREMALLKKKQGDLQSSNYYLSKLIQVQDSLNELEIRKKASELEHQYNSQIKEKEIQSLEKVNRLNERLKKRNFWFFLITAILLIVAVVFAVSLYYEMRSKKRVADELTKTNRSLARSNSALKRANAKAEEALQIKRDFVAAVSHEIRTPMTSVIGMTELLADTPLSNDQKKYLKVVKNSSSSLLVLLNDILDFSKIEAKQIKLHYEEVQLKPLLSEIELLLEKEKKENVEFELNVDDDVPQYVYIDQNRMRQVLVNLLHNAFKFTHEGKVQLTVKQAKKEKTLNGYLYDIVFQVKDTGIGISKDKLKWIFESFHQADSSISKNYGGVGLGLSITKGLVKLMGSDLKVESREGEGTTFSFKITSKGKNKHLESENFTSIEDDSNPGKSYPLNILIVDDNKINREMLDIQLRKMGYKPLIAKDGEEAINIAVDRQPDLIFMDIMMPGIDGIEATRKIREELKDESPIIIALSADTFSVQSQSSMIHTFDDYMSKPFFAQGLLEAIKKWYEKMNS